MISITNMRPFLFGPTSSIMNVPEFQRLRAQTVQRLKEPVTVQRFKPRTSASKSGSKRKVSFAEAQERLRLLTSKGAANSQPAKPQMSAALAEARLYRLTSGAAAQTAAVALGLRCNSSDLI